MRRPLPLVSLVSGLALGCAAIAAASTLFVRTATADYVAPVSGAPDPNDPSVGSEATPKPGKRKFYMVEVEAVERPKRNVSITFDPLSLLLPIFEMHVDVRLSDDFAIGFIGGYGKAKLDAILIGNEPEPPKSTLIQVGAKAMYFAQGDFESGLHVGLEALYTHAQLDGRVALGTGSVASPAAGLVIGPIIGWKLVTKAGFTFDSAIGVGLIAAKQKSSDPEAPSDDRSAVLISHLLIGWSF